MNFKKIAKFLLAMVAIVFSTTLISCTEDKNEFIDNTKSYSLGMSIANGPTEEAVKIIDAYQKALGIDKSTFTLSGETEANDAEVKSKCEKAQKELSAVVIKGYYVVSVTRGTHKIYSAPFGVK